MSIIFIVVKSATCFDYFNSITTTVMFKSLKHFSKSSASNKFKFIWWYYFNMFQQDLIFSFAFVLFKQLFFIKELVNPNCFKFIWTCISSPIASNRHPGESLEHVFSKSMQTLPSAEKLGLNCSEPI